MNENRELVLVHIHRLRLHNRLPAVVVESSSGRRYFERVEILGPSVLVQAKHPNQYNALCWLETRSPIEGFGEWVPDETEA